MMKAKVRAPDTFSAKRYDASDFILHLQSTTDRHLFVLKCSLKKLFFFEALMRRTVVSFYSPNTEGNLVKLVTFDRSEMIHF